MIIDKSCKTCGSNFNGKCADEGDYGYGGIITDEELQRTCWDIGHDYYLELIETLPERNQHEIRLGLKTLKNYIKYD